MKIKTHIFYSIFALTAAASMAGCSLFAGSPASVIQETKPQSAGDEVVSSQTWNDDTHGSDAAPNYQVVFPQDSVNRIDITLTSEAWAALHSEMTAQFGEKGTDQRGMNGPRAMPDEQNSNERQPPQGLPQDQRPSDALPGQEFPGNFQPGNPPGNANGGFDFGETSYVRSTITFDGETWEHVGFRYSGNSTLQNSWSSGTEKISFRLDFDEYEDVEPSVTDQRFYGFKQISFKSNAMDESYIREKVASDIFREAGVVSSQTAFYEVYMDYGEGPQYFGLYTAVEIVDDTVIKTQFEDGSGNVYKPDGSGAAFVEGTFTEESFEKQTNEDEADWSDIQAVFSALHSEMRTSDPEAWRAGLEAVFDVDAFIHWLAVDTIIQNWDTYGAMAHNYYLYTDPEDGLVTWIPWDNNMALSANAMGPGRGNGGPGGSVRDLDLSSVGDQWPLIQYLMDDPVYQAKYKEYLQETIQGAFQPEKLATVYAQAHDLIAPYVQKEVEGYTQLQSFESFTQSVSELSQHALDRYNAVVAYLAEQP